MPGISIKTATAQDRDRVVGTVVCAFSTDPASRWLYPGHDHYFTDFPGFVRAFAGKAFEHDSAYYVDGFSGAALWLPPGVHPDEHALIAWIRRTVAEREQAEVFEVLQEMNRYHPTEPQWYLSMIGVEAAHQHKGYGSALLKHVLDRSDEDGMLAYLESSNAKNIPLYIRHGFELLGTIQVGSSPPLFPMLRTPRAAFESFLGAQQQLRPTEAGVADNRSRVIK